MRLDRFISRKRVCDLQSVDLQGALRELLDATVEQYPELGRESLLKSLMQRENMMTTYLGYGVAMPHVRIKMKRRYVIAVGRSRAGIRYDGTKEEEDVRLIILLLANENARDYLQVLAALATLVKDREFVESLLHTPSEGDLYDRLHEGFGGDVERSIPVRHSRVNRMMLKQAERIARGTECQAMVVFGDASDFAAELVREFSAMKTILVTSAATDANTPGDFFADVIQVRSYSTARMAQLRSAILVGISRGTIDFKDRLCCVGGIGGSDQLDTVVVVDVGREFKALLSTRGADFLPADVKPEVLERVMAVATELAVEGREGRPVGCFFVLGDTDRVEQLTKPLVMNPFFGYKDEDKNILNPFMDETVKEFSSVDGAFVIRGDGVVLSAGSLIQAADYDHPLPSGLGTRHAAAAAISVATDCIAIVVSSSSGQVTLFRRGVMVPLTEKNVRSGAGGSE